MTEANIVLHVLGVHVIVVLYYSREDTHVSTISNGRIVMGLRGQR